MTAALALGLVAIAGTAASAAVAAAPSGVDRIVSLSGTIDSSCGSGLSGSTPVYTSVQAAVNAAAFGEQIYVCAGTYVENVSVTTNNIDLLGPNWNDPTGASDAAIIRAASDASPVVNFGTGSDLGNGVRGFTLQNGTYGVRSQATTGCCWADSNTEGIRNNVITGSSVAGIETNGIDTGLIAGNRITPDANADGIRTYDAAGALNIESNTIDLSGTGVGVTIGGANEQCCQNVGGSTASAGNTISGGQTGILVIDTTPGGLLVDANTIRFNTIDGPSQDGVRLEGPIFTTNVHDNTITDAGRNGVYVRNTSSSLDATSIRMERNTISDPAADGVAIEGYVTDIYVGASPSSGNTITNAGDDGVSVVGVVESGTDQLTRQLSIGVVYVTANTITNPADDGVLMQNVETGYPWSNNISGADGEGLHLVASDYISAYYNTISGSAGDGVLASDVGGGILSGNTITGNAGDGIELTSNTSSVSVTLNTVNQNASGVRITSPTVRASNFVSDNNLAQNTGYACEDQSSGTISNPPATGTQGNDWTTTNTGAALQSPAGICGATLTVTGPIPDGTVGTAYSSPMSATGAPGPYTYYAALPPGLSINSSTGVISGTPTNAVNEQPVYVWVASAGGVWGQYTEPVTITAASGMTASATLPDGTLGTAYTSPTPTASGGTGPYTWAASGLPAGLTINPTTGVVSGTPTVAVANQTVTYTVTDATGQTVTFTRTITILPDTSGVPLVDPMVGAMAAALGGLLLLSIRVQRRRTLA